MPGITGIICKHTTIIQEEKLNIMLNSMLHEPFYTHGTYINREKGFFIGYVSMEDSYSDCMPIYNENKNLVLFLTGECYVDDELINGLRHRGHEFNPENASPLIHLYEEQGEAFIRELNGWYNGIILDINRSKAVLFNDRYGIRRIYYHETDDAFIFSSEAKSLLKAFPPLRDLDPRSMGEYLTYDCVLGNRTYFSKILLLPPGSTWNFSHGYLTKKRYFDPASLESQTPSRKDQFFEELKEIFKKVLPRYFKGKSIGLSLTGGLDTRSIIACINPAPEELPCYTFGGMYRDILDVRIAPQVAKVCNQTHQVLRLNDQKYLSEYPSHVKRSIYISDGLESVDKADVIYFSKLARQVAPIRMTGIYGSQVLKSVSGLKERSPSEQLINQDFKKYLAMAKGNFKSTKKKHNLSSMLFNEIPWWWNGFISTQSTQVTVRSPYLDNDFIKVLYKAPNRELDFGAKFQLDLISDVKPELMRILTTGTHGGSSSRIISELVKKYIKLLMVSDKVYIREKLPYSATNLIGRIDYLLSPLHLDKLFMGFSEFRRYRVWFRDQLSDFLKETLLNHKTYNRPYWNEKYIEKIVNDHTNGRGTYLREIRKVLQIELIHRVLIEDI
jgi:asparagine synthase (glutamine-hydrolysing)